MSSAKMFMSNCQWEQLTILQWLKKYVIENTMDYLIVWDVNTLPYDSDALKASLHYDLQPSGVCNKSN